MDVLKWITIFLISLFMASFVVAAPPFTQESSSIVPTLSIVVPKESNIVSNELFKFQIHVFNSTGYPIKHTNASCSIHIYANDGSHLVEDFMRPDADNDFDLNYNLTLPTGDHSYIVWCNSTSEVGDEDGFISSSISVTENGLAIGGVGIAEIVVFIFLIIIFIVMAVANRFLFFKWACFLFAFYEAALMLGYVYGTSAGLPVAWILWLNFLIVMSVGFGIVILSMMTKSMILFSFDQETVENAGYDDKGFDKFNRDKFEVFKQR